jgi:hypothetical protein
MSVAMREKARSLNDQLAMQLFTLQASQITDPDAMEYFNLKRKYELERMRRMVADMEVSKPRSIAPPLSPLFGLDAGFSGSPHPSPSNHDLIFGSPHLFARNQQAPSTSASAGD